MLFVLSSAACSALDFISFHNFSLYNFVPCKGGSRNLPGGNPAKIDAPSIATVPEPHIGSNN